MITVPNVGEKEMLKDILAAGSIILGLYKNQVVPGGNETIDTLEELRDDGSRTYAAVELDNAVLEGAAAADKWSVSLDANGKAAGAFDNVAQQFTFGADDVADGETAYGAFAYRNVIPFTSGSVEIRPGDIIAGAAGTAVVTSVLLASGSWAAGTAAGEIRVKSKTGVFTHGEALRILGAVATASLSAGGTGYSVGDILTFDVEGASGAKIVVTQIGSYGNIVAFVVVEGGQNYSVDTDVPTVALTGSGNDDALIDIATLATTDIATTNTGTVNAGDAVKRLLFIDPFSTAQVITPAGFAIQYPAALTVSSAA